MPPCHVGLELDPLVANDTSSSTLQAPLPALLLGELEPPEGLTGHQAFVSQHWYLCLAADNRWGNMHLQSAPLHGACDCFRLLRSHAVTAAHDCSGTGCTKFAVHVAVWSGRFCHT